MNVRDRVERIKIWFKKFTGEFEKEEKEKALEKTKREMEEVYARIKEIPPTKWTLIEIEPDPWKKEMRGMYQRHRRSIAYCLFDDGSSAYSFEEYKHILYVRTESVGIAFYSDSCYFRNLIYFCFYDIDAEMHSTFVSSKLKISISDKGLADLIKSNQDIVDRDNIESKIIDFFYSLREVLIPVKESDFFAGQRSLPIVLTPTLSPA